MLYGGTTYMLKVKRDPSDTRVSNKEVTINEEVVKLLEAAGWLALA
jgi:hypothetical protein